MKTPAIISIVLASFVVGLTLVVVFYSVPKRDKQIAAWIHQARVDSIEMMFVEASKRGYAAKTNGFWEWQYDLDYWSGPERKKRWDAYNAAVNRGNNETNSH